MEFIYYYSAFAPQRTLKEEKFNCNYKNFNVMLKLGLSNIVLFTMIFIVVVDVT